MAAPPPTSRTRRGVTSLGRRRILASLKAHEREDVKNLAFTRMPESEITLPGLPGPLVNARLLIDAVVHQTMVLIAQLSTSAGIRAPLSHVANQVFMDLVSELERQGLGRKVIADMFGLALRSYQQKVQRLSESETDWGTTLWEAVLGYLSEHEVASRTEIVERFAKDDVATVASILGDLVETGLVYRTGRGDDAVYRVTRDEDIERALGRHGTEADSAVVWVTIYRSGPITRQALATRLHLDAATLDGLVDRLVTDGRVEEVPTGATLILRASVCLIPLSSPAGWEAAMVDHHGAMVGTLCSKLRSMAERTPAAGVGGSTFSFNLWPGHPHEERVRSLLDRTRAELSALWDEVRAHNERAGCPEHHDRVTFYFGQNVRAEGNADEAGNARAEKGGQR